MVARVRFSGCFLRRCYECGYPLGRKDIFCPRCGTRQRPPRGDRLG